MQPTDVKLKAYNGVTIGVQGKIVASVGLVDMESKGTFFVVPSVENILGLDILAELKIMIDVANRCCFSRGPGATVGCVEREDEFADIFSGEIGLLYGFEHRVRMREGCTPRQQKLRRLPLAIRGEVKAQLDDLERRQIIERVNPQNGYHQLKLRRKSQVPFVFVSI